ncbi:MAG: hypothetical protein M1830_005431 [Pleopsidium flavum]|nr:MAG: hypothetical protein M1830_005431 [Pleopsidium flavum]
MSEQFDRLAIDARFKRPLQYFPSQREQRRCNQLSSGNDSATVSSHQQELGQNVRLVGLDRHVDLPTDPDQGPTRIASSIAAKAVVKALREQDHDQLLRAFLEASTDSEYVRSIPSTTFTEILYLLEPKYFVEAYKDVHYDLSSAYVQQLGIRPIQTFFADFVGYLQEIISKRREGGHVLGIVEYKMLLNCARSVSDKETATAVWNDMRKDKVQPDTVCYNHYLEVKCWSGAYLPAQRPRLRVIPYNMVMRSGKERREEFRGYQVGNPWGLKLEIVRLFDGMVREGMLGDEKTFALMMTAMGREGDLKGVESILKKVWGVDVTKLMEEDEVALEGVNPYPTTSPLRPTTQLLFTIAHIFGSNNDIPTALRLVDYVSRQYSLQIPRSVWSHLLEWTFVLSERRYGPRRTDGSYLGRLPLQSVASLWDTMVSEPYNIQPTMPMYNRYIKNLNIRQMVKPTIQKMREGKHLYQDAYRAYRIALRQYVIALRSYGEYSQSSNTRIGIYSLQRKLERARMRRARDYTFLKRWVRLLLGNTRWNYDWSRSWERRGLADAIEEWRPFLPARVTYPIRGGIVSLDIKRTRRSTRRSRPQRRPVVTRVYINPDGTFRKYLSTPAA